VDGAETQRCVVRDFEDACALGRSVRWTVEYTRTGYDFVKIPFNKTIIRY
jgi:hypothetical protein